MHGKNLPKPKADSLCHLQNVQMKFLYDPGDLENKVQVKIMTCNQRVLSLCILGIDIKSLSPTVTDVCPIGYNGKIQLLPIKSRNEDAVTQLLVCLVVII